jgi:transcriptional regulator with XRE-family HTH domain
MLPRRIMRTERDPHDEAAALIGRPDSDREGATAVSDWLRTHLKARRMSQRQLAEKSGVDHSSISRLLAGGRTPSLRTATQLAKALGVAEPSIDDPDPAAVRAATRPLDPIAAVERALRADDRLAEADIARLMRHYHALRRETASRAAASAPAAPPRRDAAPHVVSVTRAHRPERSDRATTTRGRSRLA